MPSETTQSERIKAEHGARTPARAENVGSLLRPKRLLDAGEEFYEEGHVVVYDEERQKDRSQLRALEDAAIADAVQRQIDAGLDVVTDGELRRYLFLNSFFDAISGLAPNDVIMEFVGEDGSVVTWPGPPMVVDRLRKVDSPAVLEVEYLKSLTDYPFKVTFPAPSLLQLPTIFKEGVTDKAYESHEALFAHILEIEKELVAEAVAAGATYVQFDYPIYPHLVDPNWANVMTQAGADLDVLTDAAIAADREIVESVPDGITTAMHICRGNYRSRWLCEGSLEPLAERLFNELPHDIFLCEWDDQRRDGTFESIRFVPKGRIMAMGLISTKKPELESEDDLLRQMEEASRYLDISQLAIACQCGFASGWQGNEIDEDTQWRKLELVGSIADRLWPRR